MSAKTGGITNKGDMPTRMGMSRNALLERKNSTVKTRWAKEVAAVTSRNAAAVELARSQSNAVGDQTARLEAMPAEPADAPTGRGLAGLSRKRRSTGTGLSV